MRIVNSIILLLTSVAIYAQSPHETSLNMEPYRSGEISPLSAFGQLTGGSNEVSINYLLEVDEWQAESGRFTTTFEAPFSWIGRQSFISIGSATAPYTLWVDGREVGRSINYLSPAQFNISRYIKDQTPTSIAIELDATNAVGDLELAPSSSPAIGTVRFLSQPTLYLRDIEVSTTRKSGSLNASIALIIKSEALNERTSRFSYELLTPSGAVAQRGQSDITLDMRREDTIRLFVMVPDSLAWSVDNPALYRLNITNQYRGRNLEYHTVDIGLRSIEVDQDGVISINGNEQRLKALKIFAQADRSTLLEAKSKGYNTLQIAAGEHRQELYNLADSIGLYLIATAPINSSQSGDDILLGGNPSNDPERTAQYLERTTAIYTLGRLHPSVVAFSLADESLNGINLYESYLYLKGRESQRPIIYEGSGEQWNNDKLKVEFLD